MYPFMTLCVHFQTLFWLTVKIYPFTVLLFNMSTDVPVHQYTCSVCFFFFGITCTMTFQLVYWSTYTQIHPKIYLYVYLHAFICLNTKTHLSPQLLVYMTLPVHVHTVIPINHLYLPINVSTALHVHRYTCSSVYLFSLFPHFRHNMYSYLSSHLLGYVHTDPHASPLPRNKDLPVTTTTCVPALKCTWSWACLFIFIL